MLQNFAVFTDNLAAAKLRTDKMSSHALASTKSSACTKFRAAKIVLEGLDGKSVKFCTSENYPLCGNLKVYIHVFYSVSP